MTKIAIEARAVTKRYGKGNAGHEALRGVSIEAHAGEMLILAGPSGSGKTTLLSILGCILRPTTGSVSLLGDVVSDRAESALPRIRLERIGFVFQSGNLIESLTALDNVALILRLRGERARTARARAAALLERLGVGDRAQHLPSQLSGGQRQRVAIARALAGAPPVLLADEPTASLDAESGLAATTLLKEMTREGGHTAVVVTHDSRIFHLADRIVHIDDGRIVGAQA